MCVCNVFGCLCLQVWRMTCVWIERKRNGQAKGVLERVDDATTTTTTTTRVGLDSLDDGEQYRRSVLLYPLPSGRDYFHTDDSWASVHTHQGGNSDASGFQFRTFLNVVGISNTCFDAPKCINVLQMSSNINLFLGFIVFIAFKSLKCECVYTVLLLLLVEQLCKICELFSISV